MKSLRFILALVILFGPAAGARAQVAPGVGPQPPLPPVTSVPPLPSVEDVVALPFPAEEQRPTFVHQGVLVERLSGEVVREEAAEQSYNPASAIKLVTALAALRTFGAKHRFATAFWIAGTFDKTTGTVTGDLIVSGRDPSFHDEHAVAVARELNQLGIRTVTGDLVVAPRFTMNFSPSSQRSGERLYDTLDATRRPAAATRAWYESRVALRDAEALRANPSVAVMGAVYVAPVPAGARALLTHRSSTLVDVLKVLLCYSNNFMAERLGESIGGPAGLRQFLVKEYGIPEWEVRLASTSGLGINRLSPRSMMKVYAGLRKELAKHKLEPSDILPVAGVDPGTLQKRYAASAARGSIIGKTGTLGRTDGGASALVGEMRAQNGETLLFVIFHRRGSVYRFRQDQDTLLGSIQFARGGPAPFAYVPHALAMRLADTEFDARTTAKGEYESISN